MQSDAGKRRAVQTIPAEASVHEAAERMAQEAVGSLVVLDEEEKAIGILTDRDLALRCVAREIDPARLCVADVMTTPFVHGEPGEDLDTLIRRMRLHGIRRIPICQDGRPVGMVALDDALQVLARGLADLGSEARAKFRDARRKARFEHVRGELHQRLEELHERLAFASWYARESFLGELDEIRDKVRGALSREEADE